MKISTKQLLTTASGLLCKTIINKATCLYCHFYYYYKIKKGKYYQSVETRFKFGSVFDVSLPIMGFSATGQWIKFNVVYLFIYH